MAIYITKTITWHEISIENIDLLK